MNSKRRLPHGKKHSVGKTGGKSLGEDPQKIQKVTKLGKAKVKRITARGIGRQAAYKQLLSDELCRDLGFSFARESAKGTGDSVGDVRDRYDAIVLGFAAVGNLLTGGVAQPAVLRYSLSSVLRSDYETDEVLSGFVANLDNWVRDYVWACIRGEQRNYSWTLKRHVVSRELLSALAEEYVRDREGLMRFLSACFKRWRKVHQPDSLWRVRFVTQQVAARYGYDRKRVLDHLQKIGVIPSNLTPANTRSLLSKIGQYLSRDQRTATGNDILIALRAAGRSGMTEAEISQRIFKRNVSSGVLSDVLGILRRSGQAKYIWEKANGGRRKRWFAKKQPIKSKRKSQ
jgi:hypothetical protein